jgi:predicted ATPase
LGFSLSCLGEFTGARKNFENVLALYEPQRHTSLTYNYGQDPKAAGAAMLAWNLWHLGYPESAVRICNNAVAYARELNHTNTRGYVETFGAVRIQLFRRDRDGVQRYVNSMTALCEEQKLVFWLGFIKTFEGWILGDQGRYQAAIDTIQEGTEILAGTGTVMFKPHSYALLAQAYVGCGRVEEALEVLDDARQIADRTAEHWITPELHRLQGEVLVQAGIAADFTAAESCFEESLRLARERAAKSWELRTATSLARLRRQQGKVEEARSLLRPVYDGFTEGFDTRDLQDAMALLQALE